MQRTWVVEKHFQTHSYCSSALVNQFCVLLFSVIQLAILQISLCGYDCFTLIARHTHNFLQITARHRGFVFKVIRILATQQFVTGSNPKNDITITQIAIKFKFQ